ncbi:MAG TPA: carboxyl transferase domain-containing protein [Baekduia sp.]|jgi:acetyl-CoA carboxylase carboxyltransferase component
MSSTDELRSSTSELHDRAQRIRTEMGGAERIDKLHEAGRWTAREHIDALLDPDSFREIGTFARSVRPEDRDSTPGDGKVGGRGTVEGRRVAIVADDQTVKRGSTSLVGARKMKRIFDMAVRDGVPLVFVGETGGARVPDIMGGEGFTEMPPPAYIGRRRRRVPLVTLIVGESFGNSSFVAASSDLTIQVRGTCLAITSPRVLEMATGEDLTMDQLGGPDVHARVTGQIDLVAEDPAHAAQLARRFLSFLPSNADLPAPITAPVAPPDVDIEALVPENRRRAWDMRKLVHGLCDEDSTLELQPEFGRSVVTTLGRIEGRPVGIVGSQPMQQAGVLGPDACDKATRFICLCDAYGIPLIFLHDTPGFMVGSGVEHRGLLHKAMMMWQAVALAGVPRLAVIVRKSYGVADFAMSGVGMESDLLCAWPSAEVSFMDPETAANILLPADTVDRAAERTRIASEMTADIGPYGPAGIMRVDEIIEPASTRAVLAAALGDADGRTIVPAAQRPLSTWPQSW